MLAGIEQSRAGAYALVSQPPLVDAFLFLSASRLAMLDTSA